MWQMSNNNETSLTNVVEYSSNSLSTLDVEAKTSIEEETPLHLAAAKDDIRWDSLLMTNVN